jgi:hypothetical protein
MLKHLWPKWEEKFPGFISINIPLRVVLKLQVNLILKFQKVCHFNKDDEDKKNFNGKGC